MSKTAKEKILDFRLKITEQSQLQGSRPCDSPIIINPKSKIYSKKGFTIVELLVVIIITGILTTISIISYTSVQYSSRDSQRSSKIAVIAEALEKYYNRNGEYPDCTAMTQSAATVVSVTLVGMNPNALATPSSTNGTNSIICSNPTTDAFGYIGGGTDYTLKYLAESTGSIVPLASRHS